ncbi:hypothetical protein [Hymenobacter antarcticus]|uniref:Uncharacterized protein n=1 Tax=Hymenobacter antarcticus TaxID=486270 RepID=A0ABP7QEU6_9BACT
MTDKLVGNRPGDAITITASNPHDPTTFRETSTFDYPVIAWAASITDAITVTRRDYSKPWTFRQQNRDSRKTDNPDIALTILAE